MMNEQGKQRGISSSQAAECLLEPDEGHELRRPPRAPDEPVFNRLMNEHALVNAVCMGCLAFTAYGQTAFICRYCCY